MIVIHCLAEISKSLIRNILFLVQIHQRAVCDLIGPLAFLRDFEGVHVVQVLCRGSRDTDLVSGLAVLDDLFWRVCLSIAGELVITDRHAGIQFKLEPDDRDILQTKGRGFCRDARCGTGLCCIRFRNSYIRHRGAVPIIRKRTVR